MTPFFSVVIPVYNRAGSLGAGLRSVLSQTEQDFEIIVVDDGSVDSPERVVETLGDPRIIVVRQENRGGGAARNAGIDRARGQYIAFLDSDDRFLPHHLLVMRRLVQGTENMAAYAPVIVDRGDGRSFVKPPRALKPDEHMAEYLLCDRGFVPTITLVVPRDWAMRVRYDETLPFAQDTDFAIRLFAAGCRFAMAGEPTSVWNDIQDPKRVSAGRKNATLQSWLERTRSRIPARSYYGARGWIIAKGVVQTRPLTALYYYLSAVLRGCYRPRLALVILTQILAPDRLYRRMADWMIAWRRGRIWPQRACMTGPALD
ncbi:MAG TPA: glycosyltransferase family 2 protein [Rhizomicrobium sp.]|jgi:glycosyltransferase involved in cell wall biosynthesis